MIDILLAIRVLFWVADSVIEKTKVWQDVHGNRWEQSVCLELNGEVESIPHRKRFEALARKHNSDDLNRAIRRLTRQVELADEFVDEHIETKKSYVRKLTCNTKQLKQDAHEIAKGIRHAKQHLVFVLLTAPEMEHPYWPTSSAQETTHDLPAYLTSRALSAPSLPSAPPYVESSSDHDRDPHRLASSEEGAAHPPAYAAERALSVPCFPPSTSVETSYLMHADHQQPHRTPSEHDVTRLPALGIDRAPSAPALPATSAEHGTTRPPAYLTERALAMGAPDLPSYPSLVKPSSDRGPSHTSDSYPSLMKPSSDRGPSHTSDSYPSLVKPSSDRGPSQSHTSDSSEQDTTLPPATSAPTPVKSSSDSSPSHTPASSEQDAPSPLAFITERMMSALGFSSASSLVTPSTDHDPSPSMSPSKQEAAVSPASLNEHPPNAPDSPSASPESEATDVPPVLSTERPQSAPVMPPGANYHPYPRLSPAENEAAKVPPAFSTGHSSSAPDFPLIPSPAAPPSTDYHPYPRLATSMQKTANDRAFLSAERSPTVPHTPAPASVPEVKHATPSFSTECSPNVPYTPAPSSEPEVPRVPSSLSTECPASAPDSPSPPTLVTHHSTGYHPYPRLASSKNEVVNGPSSFST